MNAPHEGLATSLWAPWAWIDGSWRADVQLHVGPDGRWAAVDIGVPPAPAAEVLPAAVLPGLVDAHSHAFQRAFAGQAETLSHRPDGTPDDFWSWRDRMYGVALAMSPDALRETATRLYRELLQGGYTQVCEFHYLHHDTDGRPYADPLAMCRALADAAQATGIGLTLLPVLYERAGFAQAGLRDDQRRFATTAEHVIALRDGARTLGAGVTAGVAIHSLRAAGEPSIRRLLQAVGDDPGPIHVHVAEQQAEVDDCRLATGLRPVEWLTRNLPLDKRWQLVHATHVTPDEIAAVAGTGAGVVICPGTEANLGDGLTDMPGWLAAGVPLAIGSDSQVSRDWREELRWLEGGQRLWHRRRNVLADAAVAGGSTAARLFERALAGGAVSAGLGPWGMHVGARADLLLVDHADSALAGVPPERLLDVLVFTSPVRPFAGVMVSGRWALAPSPAAASPTAPHGDASLTGNRRSSP